MKEYVVQVSAEDSEEDVLVLNSYSITEDKYNSYIELFEKRHPDNWITVIPSQEAAVNRFIEEVEVHHILPEDLYSD